MAVLGDGLDEARLDAGSIAMSLQKINTKKPLVHCMTNYVVANFTANGLLAIGSSPVMADAQEEVDEMIQFVRIHLFYS